jgi:hypothetical protein
MNRKQHILLLILFSAFSFRMYAQDSIIVHKDARLDILTAKQAAVNKLTAKMTNGGMFKGFRLQVINTRSREEAFKVKAELIRKFPEYKSYAVFQSPYFKIRLGNFIERADAEEARKAVARQYPQGVYVVEDVIEYTPPADEDELLEMDK